MDVVYPYKSCNDGIELRYSLRTLINIEHDNVYVIGDKEDWFDNINYIEHHSDLRDVNDVRDKLHVICNTESISDNFIYMMDDIYIMKQYTPKWYYKCKIKEHIDYLKTRDIYPCEYDTSIEKEYEYFGDRELYELHKPVIFNKEKLLYVLDNYKGCGYMGSYALHYNIKGEYHHDTLEYPYKGEDMFSSYDDNLTKDMINYLNTFNKSIYEK